MPEILARGAPRFVGVVALFLVTTAVTCGPSVPVPDVCDQPSNASVTGLELGQGSPMFAMRVRIEGQSAQCVPLETRVLSAQDQVLADELLLLGAYEQDEGSFIIDTHWVVLKGLFTAADEPASVEITVAGSTATRTVVLDQ